MFDDESWVEPDPVAMPAEGGATSVNAAAWWERDLSYVIHKYVDSEFARPLRFADPTMYNYAVTPQGALYQRGQPAPVAPAAPSLLSNPVVIVAGLAALGLLAFAALK